MKIATLLLLVSTILVATPCVIAQQLQNQTNYPVTGTAFGVTVADFNSDGIPDIANANYGDSSVSVIPGRGDGTFGTTATTVLNNASPLFLEAGDFNGDGLMDLAIAASKIYIYLGRGNGRFQLSFASPIILLADFNRDGNLDVATAGTSSVSLYYGIGDGTFQPEVIVPSAISNLNIALGDFNGDGASDLVVIDFSSAGVLLNTGA